jgi:uncharacterized membrane protein YdjX (TVP38/TMEM64 family)
VLSWSNRFGRRFTGLPAFCTGFKPFHARPLTFAQTAWHAHTLRVPSVRRVIFWQAAAVVFAIALAVTLSRFFPVVSFVEALQERVMGWGAWAGIFYPLLFAVCNILLLPGGVVAVGGGFFFGLWWGFLIVFAGNIVSTAISFALSRFVARRWFQRKLSANPTLRALGPVVERESWKIILLSQLHPLFPTSLLNYFYGLTQIRFSRYMLWASIGRMPGLFFYAYVGTLGQLAVRIMRGKSYPRALEYWILGGAFITTVLLLVVLGRVARRAIQTPLESTPRIPPKDRLEHGILR